MVDAACRSGPRRGLLAGRHGLGPPWPLPSMTAQAERSLAVVSGRERSRTIPCCRVADLRSIASCRVPSNGSRMIYAHCSRLRGWRLRCACCIDRSCSWCVCLRSVHAQRHGLRQPLSIYTSTWLSVRGQQRPFFVLPRQHAQAW